MAMAYTISSRKKQKCDSPKKPPHFIPDPLINPGDQEFELLRDERGRVLKAPRFKPSKRHYSDWHIARGKSSSIKVSSLPAGSIFTKASIEWTWTLLHLEGGLPLTISSDSSWSVVNAPAKPIQSTEAPQAGLAEGEDESRFRRDGMRIPHGVLDQLAFQALISQHAAWLQEKPRTTLELLERLDDIPLSFPWSYYLAWIKRLNLALWHAGYTSFPYDEPNPHWYGKPAISMPRLLPRFGGAQAPAKRKTRLEHPIEPLRSRTPNRRPWAHAYGTTPEIREQQAAYALRIYNYESAHLYDRPEFTLVKVVCNLRNYFGISQEQTIKLVASIFNPMGGYSWSQEAVSLAWELVADFTPALGLTEVDGIAMQRALEVEDAVTELLAYSRSGGRVSTDEFFDTLMQWNPDLETTKTAVSGVVREITEIKTKPYRDGRNFKGFHLPSAEELLDPNHSSGVDIDLSELPEALRGRDVCIHERFLSDHVGRRFLACFVKGLQTQDLQRSSCMLPNPYGVAS